MNNQSIIKAFSLFLSGIISSLATESITSNIDTIKLIIASTLLFSYGTGITSVAYHYFNIHIYRKLFPKIGILNDLPNKDSHINPVTWKIDLEKQLKSTIRIELINVKDNFDHYIAIINPYGSIYPENNLRTFETMDKIFNYEGYFINISDIPGLIAKKPHKLNPTSIFTAELVHMMSINKDKSNEFTIGKHRPLDNSLFMKRLGLQIHSDDKVNYTWNFKFKDKCTGITCQEPPIITNRYAIIEKYKEVEIQSLIETKTIGDITNLTNISNEKITPLFIIKHGNTKFLLSLSYIDKNLILMEILIKIIINLVNKYEKI
ncbi:MAG: hypothetical protein PHP08_00015 [Candidatus Dojkabacteria bacterium]|nr:hypothetical protein [Candidatus Dojkabacteria bacterium]